MSEVTKLKRIQLSRKKGFRLPPNTVSVARPTKFGNPVKVGDWFDGRKITRAEAVKWYREHLTLGSLLRHDVEKELRGKNLACWCPLGEPCHADLLLEIANK